VVFQLTLSVVLLIASGLFLRSLRNARTVDPRQLALAVRKVVHSLDPDLPLFEVRTMQEHLTRSLALPLFATTLLAVFGGVALVLATVGIYGVIAYSVARRTRELGIRMALGARSQDVALLVLRQGVALGAMGIAIGLGAAALLTRFLSSQLFGVSPRDAAVFAGVALLLGIVSLAATYLPARRAVRVDPMAALRWE
jgi:ABC-type antimicrobial peptide transport system permease subunit